MKDLREKIRAILADDALYSRFDLPGDVDDPPETLECGCTGSCDCEDDYVTAKYALFQLIGSAIKIYDRMEGDSTGNPELDNEITKILKRLKKLSN